MGKTIGHNIERLLSLTDTTHAQLAEIAGVTRSTVSHWVGGTNEPRMNSVRAIASHFGLKESNIVDRDGMDYVERDFDGRLHDTHDDVIRERTVTNETCSIAYNLKAARVSSGMTQQEVAEALGISLSGYQKFEQGQRRIAGDMVVRIADVLNVSTDAILGSKLVGTTITYLSPSEARLVRASRFLNQIGMDALLAYADRCVSSEALTESLGDLEDMHTTTLRAS